MLTARLNAADVLTPIEDAHPDATIEVGPDPTTTGPILKISVESTTEQDSLETVAQIMSVVPATLENLQSDLNVPQGSQISLMTLTVVTEPEAITKTRNRAVIALVGAGLAGTVLLTGLLDGVLTARRERKSAQTEEREVDDSTDTDDSTDADDSTDTDDGTDADDSTETQDSTEANGSRPDADADAGEKAPPSKL